jgi:3-dehydroquinate synthetase
VCVTHIHIHDQQQQGGDQGKRKEGTLEFTPEDLINKMLIDKKNANRNIRCVIVKDFGDVFEHPVVVDKDTLRYSSALVCVWCGVVWCGARES